jgi:signal peptidase I
MRSSALDRRVRKEARILVREVRAARRRAKQAPEGFDEVVGEIEAGLATGDLARVRRGLPALGELLDELPRARPSLVAEYAWAIGSLVAIVLAIRAFVIEPFKIPSSSMLPTLETNDHVFVNKFIYGLKVPLVDDKLLVRSPGRGEVIVFIQPCEQRDYIKRVVGLAGDRIEVRCGVLHVNGRAVPSEYAADDRCELSDEHGNREIKQCARFRETHGGLAYDTYHDPERSGRGRPGRGAGRRDSDLMPGGDFPQMTAVRTCSSPNQRPGTIVLTRQPDEAGPCGQRLHYVVPEGHVFAMGDNRDHSSDSREWGSVPIENIKGKALVLWLSYRDFSWSGMRWSRIGDFIH